MKRRAATISTAPSSPSRGRIARMASEIRPDRHKSSTLLAATGGRAGGDCAKAGTARELAAAKPEEVEGRCREAQADLKSVEATRLSLREREIALENQLIGADKRRIREELDEAREQKDRAISRSDRVQAEANAWKLLVEVLES